MLLFRFSFLVGISLAFRPVEPATSQISSHVHHGRILRFLLHCFLSRVLHHVLARVVVPITIRSSLHDPPLRYPYRQGLAVTLSTYRIEERKFAFFNNLITLPTHSFSPPTWSTLSDWSRRIDAWLVALLA